MSERSERADWEILKLKEKNRVSWEGEGTKIRLNGPIARERSDREGRGSGRDSPTQSRENFAFGARKISFLMHILNTMNSNVISSK